MRRIFVVGTADTKGEELAYLRRMVADAGGTPIVVDVGIGSARCDVDIARSEIAAHHPDGMHFLRGTDRGEAITAMAEAFARFVATRRDIDAMLGIGGGGGTFIVTKGMQALKVGLPKLMVSTLASGEVGAYVDIADITMMPSVTDLAGLNNISSAVLRNAAFGIVGMAAAGPPAGTEKPAIALTMFGVTTPCVTIASEQLRDRFDCVVFHATGTGGRVMEKLVDSGLVSGVIDVTTTEVCDHLFGGVLSAGADRLGAIARTRVPYVGSVGALDMVNFRAIETVPAHYSHRNLYRHNPQVTLMRTTAEENRQIGVWIAEKLNRCSGPVRFLIPEKGVSMLDAPGQPFHDPTADAALFDAIEHTLHRTRDRRIERIACHINDPEFSHSLVESFLEIAS
ncbi:MAG TPA: Tm-1-like ATP-binding domain-containing protein [Bradyrhizobium sp.]|jgi:uncharacterized protein (UPF0261 family)|nr:Tm-1-like ATP-binding domain-containing protein [Bradyrhizobium sp.]